MPAVVIEWSDVRRHPRASKIKEDYAVELIAGTMARVRRVAPCIEDEDFADQAAAKDIIVEAIVRRANRMLGFTRESKTIGGVTHSTEQSDRSSSTGLFTAAEVAELQRMCASEVTQPASGFAQWGFPEPLFTEDSITHDTS